MASASNAAHTAEAEQASTGTARSLADPAPADANGYADAERLGLDGPGVAGDVADRPAHQWEVGEADSWEPSVTDTWNPPLPSPTSGAPARSDESPRAAGEGEAAAATLPAEQSVPPTVPPADRAAQSAREALDQALRSARPEDEAAAPDMDPARMAVSLASLAAERIRAGVPAGDGLITGLGLARQTANGLLALGERLVEPASRITASAVRGAAQLPFAGLPIRAALRSGQWVARSGTQVREKLRAWFEGARIPDHDRHTRAVVLSTKDSPERTETHGPDVTVSRS